MRVYVVVSSDLDYCSVFEIYDETPASRTHAIKALINDINDFDDWIFDPHQYTDLEPEYKLAMISFRDNTATDDTYNLLLDFLCYNDQYYIFERYVVGHIN